MHRAFPGPLRPTLTRSGDPPLPRRTAQFHKPGRWDRAAFTSMMNVVRSSDEGMWAFVGNKNASDVLVHAAGLSKRYGDVIAADNVNVKVRAGEIVGIVGPNGAGKTTTVEMMVGLRRPDAGSCTICGFDSFKQSRAMREVVGISLQQAHMPGDVTVNELLRVYTSIYENPVPFGDLLHRFDLTDKARTTTRRLSGGQRQRLALALAIIGRPRVIFLDEPTTGLDPQARRDLWDMIRWLKGDGRAIVLTTHYMDEVERLCDRTLIMDHGRIVAEGTPRALIAAHGPESVIEVELGDAAADTVALARLDAVTGIRLEENTVLLHTSDAAASLMAFTAHVQKTNIPLGDLRTRSATMDDVFIALTGRSMPA